MRQSKSGFIFRSDIGQVMYVDSLPPRREGEPRVGGERARVEAVLAQLSDPSAQKENRFMPFLTIGEQRIHYLDTGGDGPTVVLTHGLMLDAMSLWRQVEALRGEYRVIAWDQRDHGSSAVCWEPYSYWDSAEDLARLLDVLGIDEAVVGGTSQGGFVSQRFALRYPERCAGLILVATHASGTKHGSSSRWSKFARTWFEQGPCERRLDELRHATGTIGWDDEPRWITSLMTRPPWWMGKVYDVIVQRDDIHHLLGALEIPVLVLEGEHDHVVTRAMVDRMCAGLPTVVRRAIVPGAGHCLMQTHPEQVNEIIRDYLRALHGSERHAEAARLQASYASF
jgi:pimeloyl-ACP methyl ester carboxylesterase